MRSDQHTLWLEPYLHDNEVALQKTPRLTNLTNQTYGEPSLLLFIGKTSKSKALRWLTTPLRSKRSGRNCGEIHLRLDAGARSVHGSRPLIFADGPIPNVAHNNRGFDSSVDLECPSQHLPWIGSDLNNALSSIYARLLSPFTDVVCLFMADFGEVAKVADFIAVWLSVFKSSSLSSTCLPRLLIVIEDPTTPRPGKCWETHWKTRFLRLLRNKTTRQFGHAFSHLAVHNLFTNDQIREKFHYLSLKDRLLNESDIVRALRIEERMHFNGKHFNAFFDYAYDHFVLNTEKPFNFIRASRLKNPVPSDVKRHFSKFLKHFPSSQELNEIALPIVASSILLDGFPPGMHRKLSNPSKSIDMLTT
jgi:hypothetical protein